MLLWLLSLTINNVATTLIPSQTVNCDKILVCNNQVTSCGKGLELVENGGFGGCCDGCVRFRTSLQPCSDVKELFYNDITEEMESMQCQSGIDVNSYTTLVCTKNSQCPDKTQPCCIGKTTPCLKALKKYDQRNPDQMWKWRPNCDNKGDWGPVQCKGDDEFGRCFCTSKSGERLFGHSWKKDRKQMKCECARLQAELAEKKTAFDDNLKCDDNSTESYMEDFTYLCDGKGNFNSFQCLEGSCYCVDKYTGKPTGPILPVGSSWALPCFKNSSMGDPLSDREACLATNYRLHRIKKEYCLRGTLIAYLPLRKCDPDNSYKAVQCDKNDCVCMKKDGKTRINVYASPAIKEVDMNCDCARAESEYLELGYTNSPKCQSNGNFQNLVCTESLCHCLDNDGFQNTNKIPLAKKCCLPCRDVDPCTSGCPSIE